MGTLPFRIVSGGEVEKLISMKEAIECVEAAYRSLSSGQGATWPAIVHEFEPMVRDMDIKSGYMSEENLFGLKMLAYDEENLSRGLPGLSGVILLSRIKTGFPYGMVEGTSVTRYRTGAAGAIGAKYLARPDSKRVLVLGAGNQGRAQIEGLVAVFPRLERIEVTCPDPELTEKLLLRLSDEFPSLPIEGIHWEERESHARKADIIVTCTPAHSPILLKEWVSPGTHINAIGADMPEKQEVETDLTASCRLFGDSRSQVVRLGECHHAVEAGKVLPEAITEIGEVLLKRKPGRLSSEEITLFDATGIALQDLATAKRILERAEEKGMGQVAFL